MVHNAAKFCTCHDSTAVVPWAKFQGGHITCLSGFKSDCLHYSLKSYRSSIARLAVLTSAQKKQQSRQYFFIRLAYVDLKELELTRSRLKLNYRVGRDFGVGPEFGATWKQPIIPGNSQVRSCAGEEDRVMWLDLRPFNHVNFTYRFKITNHNQHAFNIKYLANLIKKYWTCFRYQKLADFLACFLPSIRVQVR